MAFRQDMAMLVGMVKNLRLIIIIVLKFMNAKATLAMMCKDL